MCGTNNVLMEGKVLRIIFHPLGFFFFPFVAGSMCQLETTCCSSEAESTFSLSASTFLEDSVSTHLRPLSQCNNQAIFGKWGLDFKGVAVSCCGSTSMHAP